MKPPQADSRSNVARDLGLIVIMVGMSVILGSCRGTEPHPSAFAFDLSVSPTPPAVGPARLLLTVSDPAGVRVDGAEVRIEGNMTHPGMPPETHTAEPLGSGRYAVDVFDFSMAGDWILRVTANHPDGRSGARDFPLRAFGAPGGDENAP